MSIVNYQLSIAYLRHCLDDYSVDTPEQHGANALIEKETITKEEIEDLVEANSNYKVKVEEKKETKKDSKEEVKETKEEE